MNFYLFFFRIRQNGHFFVNKTLELNPSLTPSVKFTIKMRCFKGLPFSNTPFFGVLLFAAFLMNCSTLAIFIWSRQIFTRCMPIFPNIILRKTDDIADITTQSYTKRKVITIIFVIILFKSTLGTSKIM